MNKHILKAIIWKESICFFRNSGLTVLFYIFLLLGTNLFMPSLYIEEGTISPWMNDLLVNNGIIMAATLTVTVGSAIISQSMGLEKREGILKILLGIGIPSDLIWTAQYIFAVACSYLCWLLSFVIYVVGIRMLYDISIEMTGSSLILALVVFPVVSTLILAVYAWLFWITQKQTAQIIYSMIPALVYMGSFYLNQALAESKLEIHIWIAVALVLVSIAGVAVIAKNIKKVSAERLFDS